MTAHRFLLPQFLKTVGQQTKTVLGQLPLAVKNPEVRKGFLNYFKGLGSEHTRTGADAMLRHDVGRLVQGGAAAFAKSPYNASIGKNIVGGSAIGMGADGVAQGVESKLEGEKFNLDVGRMAQMGALGALGGGVRATHLYGKPIAKRFNHGMNLGHSGISRKGTEAVTNSISDILSPATPLMARARGLVTLPGNWKNLSRDAYNVDFLNRGANDSRTIATSMLKSLKGLGAKELDAGNVINPSVIKYLSTERALRGFQRAGLDKVHGVSMAPSIRPIRERERRLAQKLQASHFSEPLKKIQDLADIDPIQAELVRLGYGAIKARTLAQIIRQEQAAKVFGTHARYVYPGKHAPTNFTINPKNPGPFGIRVQK